MNEDLKSYRGQRPGPEDVLLLIEVSDSSLEYDRGEKLQLHAGAGVREYWVVNIPHLQIEVFRDPQSREYRQRSVYGVGETVSPRGMKNLKLPVSSLFSP